MAIDIVLIEDNPADARLIEEYLREAGDDWFELRHFGRLADGLRVLSECGADIALLDLSLPDSHGMETFAQAHEEAPHVPFIVLTHLDDEAHAMRTVQAGAQDYLIKGEVTSHLLVRAIRYAIERKKAEEKVEAYAAELKARNVQIMDDLNMAREVQQALLPQRYPIFPPTVEPAQSIVRFHHYYRPSTSVGGDFFSVNALNGNKAAIFICDVMGHGMRAALVTAIIRGLLEKLKPIADQPGAMLTELNRNLCEVFQQTDQLIFASAGYFVVDLSTRRLYYSNAGHPWPYLMHDSGATVKRLDANGVLPGPGLGLFADAAYSETSVQLQSHDMLFLFTDGIFEVVGADGDEFGEERLLSAMHEYSHRPAAAILQELVEKVRAFSVNGGFEDDICLLAVEILELPKEAEYDAGRNE